MGYTGQTVAGSGSLALVPTSESAIRWLAIEDADSTTTWMFDIDFMLSGFGCIYGAGCKSIDTEVDRSETLGCCVHGAHLLDKTDRKNVESKVRLLEAHEWQFADRAAKKGGPLRKTKKGEWVSRKAAGACIFLNRDGFEGGAGCALHAAAERRGERPMDWKPDVCWQVPIRTEIHTDDYGYETVMVRPWQRRDWGPGGDDFNWWCIEDASTYNHDKSLYVTCRDELTEMVGAKIYDQLVSELIQLHPPATPTGATPVNFVERPAG